MFGQLNGVALVAGDAEHFVDDVGVDGCRLFGGCRGLEELGEVGLDWWCDWREGNVVDMSCMKKPRLHVIGDVVVGEGEVAGGNKLLGALGAKEN